MMISKCDECRHKINSRKCKRFPKGKPADFRPYIDPCDDVSLGPAVPVQMDWENWQEYHDRCNSEVPYGPSFIAQCRVKYREYMEGDAFFRKDSIDQMMKKIPYHLKAAVIN